MTTDRNNSKSADNAGKEQAGNAEFEWAPLPVKKPRSSSTFDYGFERFAEPRQVEGGETQFASRLYTQTYKAVANALARYLSSLPEDTKEEDLPVFQKSIVKDNDKKYVGTRVFRIK